MTIRLRHKFTRRNPRHAAQRLRRIIAGLAYLLIFQAVTSCDRNGAEKPPKIALATDAFISFIGPPAADPASAMFARGAARFGQRTIPPRVRVFTPTDATDAALLTAVNDALAVKPAALVFVVPEDGISERVAARIGELVGALVTIGPDAPELHPAARVDFDWVDASQALGAKLSDFSDGARTYVLLHDRHRNERAGRCYERFTEAARLTGGLRRLDEREFAGSTPPVQPPTASSSAPAEGQLASADPGALIAEMLAQFKHAGLIVTLTPAPWLLAPPRFRVAAPHFVTLGAQPALWPRLREGEAVALVGGIEPQLAFEALKLAADLCNGEQAGVLRRLPCEIVTNDSLEDFAKRYAAAAGMRAEELLPSRPDPVATRPAETR